MSQMIVAQPVLQLADVALLHTLLLVATGPPVAVATLPLQLLGSVPAHAVLQPPENTRVL